MLFLALTVHSLLRWAVILLGAWAVSRAKRGWFFGRPWTEGDDLAGRLFVIGFDVQVLLGLLLYFVLSPVTTGAFQNMSGAMQDSGVRFWVVEHLAAMLLGLALAHIGRVRLRRATDDRMRHRRAALFFGCALLLVLLGTPWPFMPVGRPWFPGLG
jgi:hypothetical protein